jgi:UDP-N-acetylmuramyl pentapeptide phosphotransferase/UDP-N-acetylglucosamine-1-phosphate transferase
MAFAFFCALVISYLFTPLVIKFGFALGFIDQPGERRIHINPTPRCGGLSVFISFSLTALLLTCVQIFKLSIPANQTWVISVLTVSLPLIGIGLVDDRWQIKPIYKLLGQILIGLLAWDQGLNLGNMLGMPMPAGLELTTTVFLYVAAMNAYNLIDGMDGVASGLGAITALGLSALNLILGNVMMAALCLALTGASLGFLRYNFHPARVFLGDTGSMYIGFMLMAITLASQSRTTAAVMLIIPLLTMGVPMLDTGLAIWRRSVRRAINPGGKSRISRADKDHLHHRLARKGLTQQRVAVILYSIQAVLFSVGLLWIFVQNYRMAIFTIAFFVGAYVGLRFLASLEMTDSGRWIVDGIRRPGRMQLYSSLMPLLDILILSGSLLILSWLMAEYCPQLVFSRIIRETAPPVVGGPMILIWATRYYRLQWTRARALEFFFFGIIATAGLLIGIAVSSIPFHQDLRLTLLITLVLLSLNIPLMLFLRAMPRLAQDMYHFYDRKQKHFAAKAKNRVLIYGAGFGYTLIARAESFADSSRRKEYHLVGLVDDDPYLRGRLVNGHSVLGTGSDLEQLVKAHEVDEILVSTVLSPESKQHLLHIAENFNIRITQSLLQDRILREIHEVS